MEIKMEIKTEVIFDSVKDNGYGICGSIAKREYIERNGERTYIGDPWRVAVCPGDFDIVREHAPELLPMFEALWTPEVIARWEEKKAEQSQNNSGDFL